MVLTCLHGLAPGYLASIFSERNTSYNLRESENKLNVRVPRTNYFKIVLVIVAPHCGIAFLMRPGGLNHLGR